MHISPRWHKVIRDLWDHKARTILVVLSIAVGVFAIGMINGSSEVMTREMNSQWATTNPPQATLFTQPFDADFVATVRNMPEVADAEGRRTYTARFAMARDGLTVNNAKPDATWRNLSVISFPDIRDIRVGKLRPLTGVFPPGKDEIVLERLSGPWMGAQAGDTVLIEDANGKMRELRVVGTLHDLSQSSSTFDGTGKGYVTDETMRRLGVEGFTELAIIAAGDAGLTKEGVTAVADKVGKKIEGSGRTVDFTFIPKPGEHPASETITPVMLILSILGGLVLIVSGFLVVNTMQAQLSQQTRQIGILKAIGGRAGQIMGIYYAMVLAYALLALLIAVPLGIVAARAMSGLLAGMINFDIHGFSLSPRVLGLQLGVGLLVPLLAALWPIVSAVRVSAREAMSDYGLSAQKVKRSRTDALLGRVRGLPRPLLLSLRNTFRRKGRLLLTLTTLVLGGAIFIAVFAVRASLMLTLDDMFKYIDYDVLLAFNRPYRIEQVERMALDVPGVQAAESWRFESARRIRPDDTESESVVIYGPPPNSALIHPNVVEGRWLLPEDENAVVVNTLFLKDEPDVQVGDTITLSIGGKDLDWTVVGVVTQTPPQATGFVNMPYLAKQMGGVGRSNIVFALTEQHDVASQIAMAQTLEKHFKDNGIQVAQTDASGKTKAQINSQFNLVVVLLLIMAILLAVVGGIGLMGTMSLNVIERTREIGVLRAIGATDRSIFNIVVVEGIIIGLLSALLGALLAFPLSLAMSNAIGNSILQASLSFTFAPLGVVLWFAVVLALATLASLLPARSASRVTVREVLAYE